VHPLEALANYMFVRFGVIPTIEEIDEIIERESSLMNQSGLSYYVIPLGYEVMKPTFDKYSE
jgi:hypothetical protein